MTPSEKTRAKIEEVRALALDDAAAVATQARAIELLEEKAREQAEREANPVMSTWGRRFGPLWWL